MKSSAQWLFPSSALNATPTTAPLVKEMYDRSRGVEFLFRLGSSLSLPSDALFTAATWFHRFYMRYPMEDYHRQEVAAACIFLVTKTDECGRKLRDVTKLYMSKTMGVDPAEIPSDGKDVEQCQLSILLAEEALLEALCFDFVVDITHAALVELFEAREVDMTVQDHAWAIAHDSYRTPLCILYPPQISAAACFILAQKLADGKCSSSLDHRVSWPAPSSSLPTPPSHQPASPDATRFALEYFGFGSDEVTSVAEALDILIEFYTTQDANIHPYLVVSDIPPPVNAPPRPRLYAPVNEMQPSGSQDLNPSSDNRLSQNTPNSTHGDRTPLSSSISRGD